MVTAGSVPYTLPNSDDLSIAWDQRWQWSSCLRIVTTLTKKYVNRETNIQSTLLQIEANPTLTFKPNFHHCTPAHTLVTTLISSFLPFSQLNSGPASQHMKESGQPNSQVIVNKRGNASSLLDMQRFVREGTLAALRKHHLIDVRVLISFCVCCYTHASLVLYLYVSMYDS